MREGMGNRVRLLAATGKVWKFGQRRKTQHFVAATIRLFFAKSTTKHIHRTRSVALSKHYDPQSSFVYYNLTAPIEMASAIRNQGTRWADLWVWTDFDHLDTVNYYRHFSNGIDGVIVKSSVKSETKIGICPFSTGWLGISKLFQ